MNNVELVIRDKKDIKILKSAILSSADIFISGDKDFIGNKNILTLTPAQFLSNYNC
ncbi:hypothetical protein FACS189459_5950 [Bacilli bacterium]|nr:hypothetical protein FACS189459_5950 [Bacilli bacterium]